MMSRLAARLATYAFVVMLLAGGSIALVAVGGGVSFESASWVLLAGSFLFGGVLLAAVPPIAEWLLRRLAPRFAALKREDDSVRELQLRARQRRKERRNASGP